MAKKQIPHVTRVRSNVKGGLDVEIGPKTLIIGDNGAGKSAIVNSLELVLGAGASDVEGRAWVGDDPRLMVLAPDGADLESTVWLDDGQTATYRKRRGDKPGTAKRAEPSGLDASLPFRDLREALTGSPEKAHSFLLHYACRGVSASDLDARLPAPLRSTFWAVAGNDAERASPMELIGLVGERVKDQLRDKKAELKGAIAVIEQAAQGLSSPTDAQIRIAEEALEAANAAWDDLNRRQARQEAMERADRVEAAFDETGKAIRQLEAFLAQADIQLAQMPDPPNPERLERLRALGHVIDLHLERNLPQCAVCSGPFDAEALSDHVASIRQVIRERSHDPAADLRQGRNEAVQRLTQLRATLAQLQRVEVDQLPEPVAVVTAAEREEARSAVSRAMEEVQRLKSVRAAWGQVIKARDAQASLEATIDDLTRLQKACASVVEDLIAVSVDAFCERVQGYLPEGDEFHIELRDGARQVFRFGLLDHAPGRPLRTALSGAEWARVLTAIGAACAEGDGLFVLIPEERMWDPVTLAEVMRALEKAPCQVVLTSTVPPKGRVRKVWAIVTVDRANGAGEPLPPEPDEVEAQP